MSLEVFSKDRPNESIIILNPCDDKRKQKEQNIINKTNEFLLKHQGCLIMPILTSGKIF